MTDIPELKNSSAEEGSSAISSKQVGQAVATHPWFQHYEQGVPSQIEIPEQPLTWLLDRANRLFAGNTAITYFGASMTYARLTKYARRFAVQLLRMGLKKGERVALVLPNIPQYPIAYYGILLAGGVVVPTNPLYTEREMQHQLEDSGAKIVVTLDISYPTVRAVRKHVPIDHVIIAGVPDFMPPLLKLAYPLAQRKTKAKNPQPTLSAQEMKDDETIHLMTDVLNVRSKQGGIEVFNLPEPAAQTDLAVLQYTGGTTGLSKGAMLTHRNLLANALQTRSWTPNLIEGQEVTLCVAPLFHSYGATVGMNLSISAGANMVLLPRFKPQEVLKAIKKYHPTLFPGIPTMYLALLREAGKDTTYFQSIKYCISGAAPLPAAVREDFEAVTHGKLVEGYGLSEASPVTHCNPLNGDFRKGSIGLPFPGIDAAIWDTATNKPLPPGELGEIMVKGPNIMQGYWKREQETEAMFSGEWMRTGDLGTMDADGYFYVTERAKDMIIASGYNVYPREVEEVLFRHEAVQEAAVAGVSHEYRGETVAAFVVLKPGYQPTEETREQILAFCKRELTAYKVPKILEFRDELPKSLIGKVLRRELRASLS
ncbi:MAG TPA: long-chain fatty acid--CoA ligase [Ktedonobacteraceae bacterium]|nr:long-chain fatty acid--CoA ligase [Ktedonobacteraceae bacterium]